ncbi:MAG: aminotransferase class V-fold PLP-dependent enzyme [Planctomycetota bacterium]
MLNLRIGALYVRRGVDLDPVLHGAAHESGLRPGTENVAYIVGLGKAAELAIHAVTETSQRLAALRDELEGSLAARVGEGFQVMGCDAERLPNTACVLFPRVSGHELLQAIPELCASTGAACHSGATVVSGTLASMGVSAQEAAGMVRLSLGWTTSAEEIEQATEKLVAAWERLALA